MPYREAYYKKRFYTTSLVLICRQLGLGVVAKLKHLN